MAGAVVDTEEGLSTTPKLPFSVESGELESLGIEPGKGDKVSSVVEVACKEGKEGKVELSPLQSLKNR